MLKSFPPFPCVSVWPLTLSTWRSSSAHSRISFLLSSRLRSARRSELGDPLLLLPSPGSEDPCQTPHKRMKSSPRKKKRRTPAAADYVTVSWCIGVINLLLPDKSCTFYTTSRCFQRLQNQYSHKAWLMISIRTRLRLWKKKMRKKCSTRQRWLHIWVKWLTIWDDMLFRTYPSKRSWQALFELRRQFHPSSNHHFGVFFYLKTKL